MAFAATQTNTTALFRNLFFRNNDNSPISSLYILNTNGRGGTYWTKTVTPIDVSSFSIQLQTENLIFSNELSSIQSSFSVYSTIGFPGLISSFQAGFQSTALYYYNFNSTLAIAFNDLSNQQTIQSNALQTSLILQTNQVYVSSIAIAQSTYDSYRNPSTFINQLSSLTADAQSAISSISTAITVYNNQIESTLTSYINTSFLSSQQESFLYTADLVSTAVDTYFTVDELTNYSTVYSVTQNFLFGILQSTYTSQFTNLSTQFSTIEYGYTSTLESQASATKNLVEDAYILYEFSTNINSSIADQVSSITSSVFQQQDQKLSNYFSTLTNQISSISSIVEQNAGIVSTLSTYVIDSVNTISTLNSTYYSQIQGLASTFSTISISSILGNVYDVFSLFEIFSNDLVISTTTSVLFIQSTSYYSTILQNNSTTNTYFSTLFQEPFTQSTIRTVSTLANYYMSSYISTLYFSNLFIISSIQSTIQGKTTIYNSTTDGNYISQLSTNITLNQSTILNNLSTPTGVLLSTNTKLANTIVNIFNQQAISSINGQQSLYISQTNQFSTLQSTLIGGQISTNSSFQTSQLLYSTLFSALFSTIRISSQQQSSLIQEQFLSSLLSYNSQFQTFLPSTAVNNTSIQLFNATSQLNALQTSSVSVYQSYTESLLATLSTAAFSTLYTEQQITLQGTNYFGTMDFLNYTNFSIRIRDPLFSGTSSSYSVSYLSNTTSSIGFKTGLILVDVSTPTSLYTNNGSKLSLTTYRWGLPTTIWSEFLPSISSANYLAMYEYTIQDNIIYTNLMNVYPRLTHSALQLQTSTNTTITNTYWRGSDLTFSWSNYSYLSYNSIGLPAYKGEIMFDILINNNLFSNAGPYDFTVSTATIRLPYLTGGYTNPVPTTIRSYIVGNQQQIQQVNLFTVLPQFQNITLTPPSGNYLAVADVSAFSDTGANIVTSTNTALLDGSGTTNAQFQMQAMYFNGTNSYLTIPNTLDLRVGTGDFTVEWYIYYTFKGDNTYPRIFSFGTYPTATFAFSIETGGSIINRPSLVMGGSFYNFPNMTASINNKWSHMAITRSGSILRFFLDGVVSPTVHIVPYNMSDSVNPLRIGSESVIDSISLFQGFLTNFRYVNGTALYTTSFTPPARPFPAVPNTQLLLLAQSPTSLVTDSSGTGKIVTNTNVIYPSFSKASVFDLNFSTYTIGPSTLGVSTPFTQLQVNSQLQTTLTSISSIRVVNIDPTQRFLAKSTPDAFDLGNSILQLRTSAGSSNYISTIQLTSSSIQTFMF